MKAYQHLEKIFCELSHIEHISAICHWDEAVMMPSGGGSARAEALATLHTLHHEMLVKPHVGEWIIQAKAETALSPWQKANVYWMEKTYLKAVCIPVELVTASKLAFIRCEQAWRSMRKDNNWQDFAPLLQENVRLIKDIAQIKASTFNLDVYDCLIDDFSPGISQSVIDPIFDELKAFLPDFIQNISAAQKAPPSLSGEFPIETQRNLGLALMQTMGFDFNHGRLDVSHHPFCGGVPQDVRVTTRYSENEFISAAMAVCHETGHALYERGLPEAWLNQPVGKALGMAMHESQSLLMEMQACRSHEFMEYLSGQVKKHFDTDLDVSADHLYRCYTYVKPGLIRVDADEVCYPLHVIMRYELEKKLMSGDIQVNDLPELWDSMTQQFLGLSTQDNYRNGVMQDVHWPCGAFGYFPAYTMGAIIAAQLFKAAKIEHPGLLTKIAQGDFTVLLHWLRKNVHQHGRLLTMNELLSTATGKPLMVDDFMDHLKSRYNAVS